MFLLQSFLSRDTRTCVCVCVCVFGGGGGGGGLVQGVFGQIAKIKSREICPLPSLLFTMPVPFLQN